MNQISLNRISTLLGPILFFIILLLPTNLEPKQQQFLAIFSLVTVLWLFSEVPLFISGLLGVVLSILIGITSPALGFAPFADPIIFLFLGGFLLARALEITALDQRLAEIVLSFGWVNRSPRRVIFAFYSLGFILSMWISNTAAMALLLPVSYGVIKKIKASFGVEHPNLSERVILGLAYCVTIGGNVTPIGSPPNLVALGFLKNLLGIEIGFLEWMAISLPISLFIFTFACWWLTRGLPTGTTTNPLVEAVPGQKMNQHQKYVVGVFLCAVFLWLAPSFVKLLLPAESSWQQFFSVNLAPAVVAVLVAGLLYLLPLGAKDKVLTSKHLSDIDWPSLLLFGSGLSLGKILFESGLANLMAQGLQSMTLGMSFSILLMLFILATIFFSEVASNTAAANILVPIVIALQLEIGIDSMMPAILIALACNNAFMLPVGTPPNAMAYGSKQVTREAMIRNGFLLNIFSWGLLSLTMFLLMR